MLRKTYLVTKICYERYIGRFYVASDRCKQHEKGRLERGEVVFCVLDGHAICPCNDRTCKQYAI